MFLEIRTHHYRGIEHSITMLLKSAPSSERSLMTTCNANVMCSVNQKAHALGFIHSKGPAPTCRYVRAIENLWGEYHQSACISPLTSVPNEIRMTMTSIIEPPSARLHVWFSLLCFYLLGRANRDILQFKMPKMYWRLSANIKNCH